MLTGFSVIFDNNGGTTLQTEDGFRRNYANPIQAARDVKLLLQGVNTTNWDGNEAELYPVQEYNDDTERNGGYCWHADTDVRRIIQSGRLTLQENFGHNSRAFYEALGVEVEE